MTKESPFTGDAEDHEDDILGDKDGNQYYPSLFGGEYRCWAFAPSAGRG